MPHSDKFLFTVHGVASHNDGLSRIRTKCEEALAGLRADSFFFGKALPFKELTAEIRQFIYRTVRDRLEIINMMHLKPENRRLFIVAHSFGTLAVIKALEMHVRDLNIECLILLGSIVERDHDWDGLVGSGCLKGPPLAIIRPFDLVVRKGSLIGGGASGSQGFIATGVHRPVEVYKNGGHTAYDPDDVDDIVTVIKHGLGDVRRRNREAWLGELGLIKRIAFSGIQHLPI